MNKFKITEVEGVFTLEMLRRAYINLANPRREVFNINNRLIQDLLNYGSIPFSRINKEELEYLYPTKK